MTMPTRNSRVPMDMGATTVEVPGPALTGWYAVDGSSKTVYCASIHLYVYASG